MKMNVNFSVFVTAFAVMGRENQFSYEGKRALFEHLCDMEDSIGEEIELDVIGICCEYWEHSEEELLGGYYHLLNGDEEDSEKIETIVDELRDRTEVIPVEGGGWIVRNY